jgi:hypothetical protein
VAAAVIFVSVAAIAAEYPTLRGSWRTASTSVTPVEAVTAAPAALVIARRDNESPLLSPVAAPKLDAPLVAEAVPPRRAAPATPFGSALAAPMPTARDLFASANMARRDGNGSRASSLYRELQRRYPESVEALVSRVSFGRVLMDPLGDPAGALAQFDAYLGQNAHSSLTEEALFGRATALSQLGRPEAERDTWRSLLARYPGSIYADRARVRTAAIQ